MKNLRIAKAFVKEIKAEDGTLEAAVASSGSTDRQGEVIDQDGWKLRNYKKNPVLLWGHNRHEERPPIGVVKKLWFEGKGKRKKLLFKPKFDLADPFAKEVYRKYKDGFLNSFSVGFLPLERKKNKFIEQELLEVSSVPVPAHPDANLERELKDLGVRPVSWKEVFSEEKPYPNEHACRLKNPDDFQEGSFRSTNRTHDGKKYRAILGKLKGETKMTEQSYRYPKGTWSVSEAKSHCKSHDGTEFSPASGESGQGAEEQKGAVPYRGFKPAPEGRGWDARAAVSRIRKWAGGPDKDEISWSKFKNGFGWFDAEDKENYGAYKLPHHDAKGGKVITVWRGVAAAMAALLGARGGVKIPSGDRKSVYNHLKKHYNQFDKDAPDFRGVENQVLKGLDAEILNFVEDVNNERLFKMFKNVRREVRKIEKRKKKRIEEKTFGDKALVDTLKIVNQAVNVALKKAKDIRNSKKRGGEKKKHG